MRGHVRKKGANWYVVIELDRDDTGKRQQMTLSVRKELGLAKAATKRQAEELLVKKLRELQEGTLISSTDFTFGEFLQRWVNDYGKTNWRETTYESYTTFIKNHIEPELGDIPLPKLKPANLQRLYSKKMTEGRADGKPGGLSSRSVRYIHQIINEALSMAVRWELIPRNVAEAAMPPKLVADQRQAWSSEDSRRFLAAIGDHRLYPLYLLAISTGMRRGEILGLRWQDVDWDRGSLSISQALVATTAGRTTISQTKTDSSRRLVSLSPSVMAALRKHRKLQLEELLLLGKHDTQGLVFCSEAGTPISPRNLLRHFKSAADKAGVPVIPFHALRHTCATIMLQQGIHPKVVAERLGHSRITTTLDFYSHVMPNMQEDAAMMLEKALKS